MCRLTHVILSVPIKDRVVGGPLVILNACLSLSWPDNSFRPQSRVAQLRPGLVLSKCVLGMVVRMCEEPDVSPRVG